MTISRFRQTIQRWYKQNKRDLPWRSTRDPYKILVSEIMLQQTQVSRVIPKYKEFLEKFPDVVALGMAQKSDVLAAWSGLGYWRRARFLQETSRKVIKSFNGTFPKDTKTLQTLPGIGPYTAGALACFAFENKEAFIDTNIRRIYLHFFFPNKKEVSDKEILEIAQKAVDKNNPRDWHYALFDYGATVLKNKKINQQSKHYNKQSKFEGSFRSFRTKVVRKILAAKNQKVSQVVMLDFLDEKIREAEADYSSEEIIKALLKDKLIKKEKKSFVI